MTVTVPSMTYIPNMSHWVWGGCGSERRPWHQHRRSPCCGPLLCAVWCAPGGQHMSHGGPRPHSRSHAKVMHRYPRHHHPPQCCSFCRDLPAVQVPVLMCRCRHHHPQECHPPAAVGVVVTAPPPCNAAHHLCGATADPPPSGGGGGCIFDRSVHRVPHNGNWSLLPRNVWECPPPPLLHALPSPTLPPDLSIILKPLRPIRSAESAHDSRALHRLTPTRTRGTPPPLVMHAAFLLPRGGVAARAPATHS